MYQTPVSNRRREKRLRDLIVNIHQPAVLSRQFIDLPSRRGDPLILPAHPVPRAAADALIGGVA